MATTLKLGSFEHNRTDIQKNRKKFLTALRSNSYKKGKATSDKKTGKPVVEIEGYCACAVMIHELSPTKMDYRKAREALGITTADCRYIQTQLNDTPLTFPEIADRIEAEVFNKKNRNK